MLALNSVRAQVKEMTLKRASKDLIMAFVECAKNLILNNVRLTQGQLAALRRQQKYLRELVKPSTSLERRRLILQRGGFIGLLLRPLLGLLGNVAGGLLGGGAPPRR